MVPRRLFWPALKAGFASVLTLGLIACGGGETGGNSISADPVAPLEEAQSIGVAAALPSHNEAARFLTQASFGPNSWSINRVETIGYSGWIAEQAQLPITKTLVQFWDARDAQIKAVKPTSRPNGNDVTHGFWMQALAGEDQLRHRVAFALSQIFVVSFNTGCINDNSRGLASFYDMLARNAFGSYRKLLEDVSLHPIMGCYLSHLRNQKENVLTGRVPDENFAREVMQLFSIGLYQLKPDGTPVLDASRQPIETYGASDVSGLAKVFTGFGFDCPGYPSETCFLWGVKGNTAYSDRWSRPMVGYPDFHSQSAKSFLGVTIPAQTTANPAASLKAALDRLASHQNVGPFIGRQLIQRLVTSNPSPGYIARVTDAFESSGRNMLAMVRAILLDPEARDLAYAQSDTFGKVREPILRLSAFLRAVDARSDSGGYLIDETDDAATALAQSPLKAPSVFNFYRPGYVPPGGPVAQRGLVAPEMQIAHESSVAAYVNYMRDLIRYGAGRKGLFFTASRRDVQPDYLTNPGSEWTALASKTNASELIELINDKLFYGSMPEALKSEIKTGVESVKIKDPANPAPLEVSVRLWSALLLSVASPEFQVQK